MKKLLLLIIIFISNYSFSQNPYQVNEILKDGGNGRYSFEIKGEISFGKKVFDTDITKDAPKMHLPIFFKNFNIISITTPSGKTYSNDDLVYKTDSQYYPNGIKLPIVLSNEEAQKHFRIYGEVNFNGIYTPFVKSLTNTSYAKDNEFWIDNAGFKYDIKQKIIANLENENKLEGLSRLEKNKIINTELERLFFSNNPPRINKVILEPYGKGSQDLSNLMQLASQTETLNKNPSEQNSHSNTNDGLNQQTVNNDNSNASNQETEAQKLTRLDRERGEQIIQETEDNIARVKQSSDEIGNEVTNMFQNGVTPEGFFNMSQSFYGLNTNTGNIAGSFSSLAGVGVQFANALKAERDENIRFNLEYLENKSSELQNQYQKLEQYAKNNDYTNMIHANESLNIIESEMMFRIFWLSRKANRKQRSKYYESYKNFKSNYIKRLILFQELETKKFVKNIIETELNEKEIIEQYISLGHNELINSTKEYKYFKYLRKIGGAGFYTSFTNSLIPGRIERINILAKISDTGNFQNLIMHLTLLEDSISVNNLECITDENCNKTDIDSLAERFNNLEYVSQKEIAENILYKTIPTIVDKLKVKEDFMYKGTFYKMNSIKLLLSEKFETNIFMAVYSPYSKKEIPFYQAIIEQNKKTGSGGPNALAISATIVTNGQSLVDNTNNKINKLINKRLKLIKTKVDKKKEDLFEEIKYLTGKQIEF